MADNSNSGSLLLGFALGAIVGAAVALLYAPASGEETRRRLVRRARETQDRAEDMARQGREFVERQRDNLSEVVERGREIFEEGREAYRQTRRESL